jgi:hypothetical protein
MKKYLLLLALVCLLGSSALAQDGVIMKPVTITIDFSNYSSGLSWNNNQPQINGSTISTRISVENTNAWQLHDSSVYGGYYLQKRQNPSTTNVYIDGIKVDDIVTIWGEVGNTSQGAFNIYSGATLLNTTYKSNVTINNNPTTVPDSKEYIITGTNNGRVTIQIDGDWAGIRKITIQTTERATNYFDYDPGYEEYDLYDEGKDDAHNTSYETIGNAGFTLNGDNNQAKYIEFTNTGKTINNRIAIDPTAGTWRFKYGLLPPSTDESWSNISICDLKEGDRVVFSYTGYDGEDFVRFSSVADPNGQYNGCKAFFDKYNDGIFNEGEDTYITSGAKPVEDWKRGDGTLIQVDHNTNDQNSNYLHYTQAIVITEDGHLDLAIKNAVGSRIVKIKIYSDHQASMVDEYDQNSYVSKFDITGELQAKEHIVPGGLEVHVGSDDAAQHAHVIRSGNGPVSIVNGVDGFKLPGMSRNSDTGNLVFNFNLGKKNQQNKYDTGSIPTTGTFYKFMPLENGKMTITFQAASMNYYRYDLNGDAVYYNDQGYYNHNNAWSVQFDRPNEQTVSGTCPYYLMKTTDGENFTLVAQKDVENGKYDSFVVDKASAEDNEVYYLFGGWNANNLSFTAPGSGNNNLEYFSYGNTTNGTKACGVAKLLEVRYDPEKKIYPLAKWVPNGTEAVKTGSGVPNPDTFETEYDLADLYGYNQKTSITVKKMSGNITACHPFIQKVQGENNHYKLMIDGITFANSKDQGGTILIKIGDATIKNNPVYTLTIAYSTDPQYDGNEGRGARGYSWDFSSNSLNGLKYEPALIGYKNDQNQIQNDKDSQHDIPVYTHNAAQPQDYGHYFADYFAADISQYSSADDVFTKLGKSGSGLLYDEIHAEGTHSRNSDWSFNYNLVNAGNLYDPLFMNKYDLEGDNADLIWETEGTVIKASANSSVMFNEFTGGNIHSSEKDPDRYVGIKEGSEFRIPWLMPNDRVIIWMGTGKGAFNDHVVFNIRGAYDAVHNVISPTDDYIVGGSHWNVVKNEQGQVVTNDPYYRGCYHFFAQGGPTVDGKTMPADMVFKMVGGNLCKIYKIQIYRGDRIITNEIVGAEEKDKFLLWSRAADPNDPSDKAAMGDTYNWTLQYFGKDQKLADGSNGVNNDFAAKTGCINYDLVTSTETDPTKPTYNTFSYPNDYGQIGTFRARGKDMEKNMKYVADYGEHNVTVAYQETMKYPYTWDFMDMTGWGNNVQNFSLEDAYGSSSSPTYTRPEWFDNDTQWNASYENSSTDLSLWDEDAENETYYLRLNSQSGQTSSNLKEKDNIFETAKSIDGNQVWANGAIVPETQGLWFYTLNNNRNNGTWGVTDDGLAFNGTGTNIQKVVVPNVPANAAVYMRMKVNRDSYGHEPVFKGESSTCKVVYGPELVTGTTDEYILAIKNDGAKRHLTLSLAGYQLRKLAVSKDPKKLNIRGWATESRDHVIDPELTAYLTGKDIETCVVTGVNYAAKTITLKRVYSRPNNTADENTTAGEGTTTPAYVMRKLADGDKGASILHNKAVTSLTATDGEIKILDGGFHLFVPDMHDYDKANDANGDKTITDNTSMLVARVTKTTSTDKIPGSSGNYTNYALTYKHFKLDADGNQVSGSSIVEGTEAFYRIATTGASSSGNQGYLPLETKYVDPSNASYGTNPSTNNNGENAKFSIIFEDEFENINPGITTTIDDIESSGRVVTSEGFYNLNGQKINGIPTQKGMYIVNGKKVLVK